MPKTNSWTYNEFLAFLFVYGAEMNYPLSPEELEFIQSKTKIKSIDKIKDTVRGMNDLAALDLIEIYRKKYVDTPGKKLKIRADLEGMLQTPGKHSQLEKVVVHILEKLI